MGKFENMYADDFNFTFSELNQEIARLNRLAQSSDFELKNDTTAMEVLLWIRFVSVFLFFGSIKRTRYKH